MDNQFDYIVVGAGSAGCVVAARLSEDPSMRVLLLEAGPDDQTLAIKVPAAFFRLHGTPRRWEYESEPAPAAGNRKMMIPQGRTLGGGSAVNGMMYIRGQREDFDAWRAQGCDGWGYADVLPFFLKSENNQRLAGAYHGTNGPMAVGDPAGAHPLAYAFIRAAMEMGAHAGRPICYNADFNGECQEGVGLYQTTIGHGERASTASSFLKQAAGRPNLVVKTGLHVHRVLIEDSGSSTPAAKRATGIACSAQEGGPEICFEARSEVIVSAGAIATPKVLMLSGIGPSSELKHHGLPFHVDLPGVGANYHDHLLVSAMARLREPISLFGHDRGWRAVRHAMQWALLRTGVLSTNVLEAGGFFDLDGDGRPEVQMHLVPRLPYAPGQPGGEHGITVSAYALACKSRGTIRLRDAGPRSSAVLQTNYLDHPDDVRSLVAGLRLARKILGSPSLSQLIHSEIGAVTQLDKTDEAGLEELVRREARTVYHPVGTCRMGTGLDAVVDPKLRVYGVAGLRVADASIMPTIIRGNTNATAIMIGERCASFIADR